MQDHDFTAIDQQAFGSFHWRTIVTTGLGVFCDGYDLSSVGIVLPLVLASFGIHRLSGLESAMLAASALVGAAFGAALFGLLGQKGRKRFYGLDVLVMGIAAIAQAFAPDVAWLIAIRFILGVGVGADYVLSPTIMAEHANAADRGRSLGLGFGTMWPLGALAAGLVNLVLQGLGVPPGLQWRIVLAAGAIPAFAVLYFRRAMPETARYLARLGHDGAKSAQVMLQITGKTQSAPAADTRPFGTVFAQHARMIFSAALLWMVYDMVVYATILFGPSLIARSIGLGPVEFQLIISIVFVIPASILLSYLVIDRIGRKPLQIWGYVAAAIMLAIFALLKPSFTSLPLLALIVFGLFNVAQTGPGLVSGAGILGVELSPTRIRTVAQSITVAAGRIGAALSVFVFPLLFKAIGEAGAVLVLCGLAVIGAILTAILVPETRGASLEAITSDQPSPVTV